MVSGRFDNQFCEHFIQFHNLSTLFFCEVTLYCSLLTLVHVDKGRVGLRSKPFGQDLFTFEGLQFSGFVNNDFIACVLSVAAGEELTEKI